MYINKNKLKMIYGDAVKIYYAGNEKFLYELEDKLYNWNGSVIHTKKPWECYKTVVTGGFLFIEVLKGETIDKRIGDKEYKVDFLEECHMCKVYDYVQKMTKVRTLAMAELISSEGTFRTVYVQGHGGYLYNVDFDDTRFLKGEDWHYITRNNKFSIEDIDNALAQRKGDRIVAQARREFNIDTGFELLNLRFFGEYKDGNFVADRFEVYADD